MYFFNESCELWLSNQVSNKIKELFKHNIYKHDLEETKRVTEIFKNVCAKNKIFFPHYNVYIVEFPSIGAFMLKNGDLFISSRVIELADEESNDEIAFLISHELAHILSGKFFYTIFTIYANY